MALQPGSPGVPPSAGTVTKRSQQPVDSPTPRSRKRKEHDDDNDLGKDYRNEERQHAPKRQRQQTQQRSPSKTPPALAEDVLRNIQQLQCMDDLLTISPHETFTVARQIVDNYYHSLSCFENLQFTRNTPAGADFVGRIGLFIIPVLRGDPRPLKSDNRYLLPGPHDTDIMVKITTALIYNNDHREHINIKILTTKHNTDPKKLRNSGELARDFVLMRRTPSDNSGSDESDGLCFASLEFVGTSKTYKYKTPCYMSVLDVQTYPRRCPWMDLGRLAGPIDHMILNDILHEASTRLAAPNLKKIFEYAPAGFEASLSSPSPKPTPPQNSLEPSAALSQDQELDTVVSKTRTLPVDTSAEPLLPVGNTTAIKIPGNISDLAILEYVRNFDMTRDFLEGVQRVQTGNLKES